MSAYHVPPDACDVKLDANESPWPPTPAMQRAVEHATKNLALHRYPDAGAHALKAALALHAGVPESSLLVGNGSDEIIAMLCAAFGEPDAEGPGRVVFSSPGFVIYSIEAVLHGLVPVEVPLGHRFVADADTFIAAIEKTRPNLVFLATPNNPTGTVWSRGDLERVVASARDSVVVIYEAYLAYSGEESFVDLALSVNDGRCVVLQTLSKIGLAALRVGYLVGRPEMVAELEKARPPYNLDALSQAVATAVVSRCGDELRAHARSVREERARLVAELSRIRDLELFESGANFVLVRTATPISARLRSAGIAVRSYPSGPLAGCTRITVGTPDENDRLLAVLAAG